jgi:hypothetical protein
MSRGRFNANHAHHSAILVFKDMAVVDKSSHCIRVAKIHPHFDTWICRRFAVPERHINCVTEKRLVHRQAEPAQQHEMNLVDVECVYFLRSIFDDPILNISKMRNDVWYS